MIKKLVLVFITVLTIHSYGQQGQSSPYSFYGIGSLKFKGTVENRSMGGLSIYTDSIHVNLRNPASYGGDNLEAWSKESRPVKFTVGGGYSSTNLESNSSSDNVTSASFDYLALSIPIGKLGFGFGLLPYTSVGYRQQSLNGAGDIDSKFEGEGGINKVFLGFGYQLIKGLTIGVDIQYNFGNIQNNAILYQYSDGEPIQYQSLEESRSDLSGFNLNLGITHKMLFNKKLELISSITYMPQSNLSSKNQSSLSAITTTPFGQEFKVETIQTDLASLGLEETDLVLPSKLSFGAGIGAPRKWFVGIETILLNTSKFYNELVDNGTSYENAYSLSLGGFYIPKYNSFSKYWKRVVYRAGLRNEETGLRLNDESITEFGISFGLGLPVGDPRLFSNANVGVEFGRRGTKKSNLIKENFINLQVSLSLNDRWFKKRKYN